MSRMLLLICFGFVFVGCTQKPSTPSEPSEITFGHRQIAQLLDDRPDMQDVLPSDDPILKWLIDGFNGERLGQRIYWNANAPLGKTGAEHAQPYHWYPPYISLTGGSESTPHDKWAMLVFEMHNLHRIDDWDEIQARVGEGNLTADEYAERCVEIEHLALQETANFLQQHSLPVSKHGRDQAYNWLKEGVGTFEEFKSMNREEWKSKTNYQHFYDYFNENIAPYLEVSNVEVE